VEPAGTARRLRVSDDQPPAGDPEPRPAAPYHPDPTVDDLLRRAVDLVAEVSGGRWNEQASQWREQASDWMIQVHKLALRPHDRPDDQRAAELVFMAIGEASTCWEKLECTGVFQDRRAAHIGRQLLTDLGFQVPAGYLNREGDKP
jgi:hypothetical protein